MTQATIRETTGVERDDIVALYPRAFPEEDLTPIVSTLLSGDWPVLSLAAMENGGVIGHVLFTLFDIHPEGDGALLAPLCVDPDRQGAGIGSDLVRAGLERLKQRGVRQVFVLGDPAYYARFGFAPDPIAEPPYPLPKEWSGAWQSLRTAPDGTPATGPITLPAPWMQPALWLP